MGQSNEIKSFTLHNSGAFVARMQINWVDPTSGSKGTYEPSGYHDICAAAERTINIAETGIPNGSLVCLKAVVVLGSDKDANHYFVYKSDASATAKYTISGTTLINHLEFNGCI